MVFQEKHTTGILWFKKVYYTYWALSEGRMLQLSKDSLEFIKSMESGK